MQQIGDRPGARLLIVANRLPVNVSIQENGEVDMKMASGGLVSGLQALSKTTEFQWFGWPGTDVHRNDQKRVAEDLDKRFNAVPVFLSNEAVENHYNGFSSKYPVLISWQTRCAWANLMNQDSVLWPLLHSLHFRVRFNHTWTKAYREVNEYFADAIMPYVKDDDRIWIHDFHLMLLPRLLRDRLGNRKNVRIGFFLHTPFPSGDAFSIMPLREEICDGLLSCDLAGFHIREYVDNFLNYAAGILP
jgi:trehalose 6-phosphate synthase